MTLEAKEIAKHRRRFQANEMMQYELFYKEIAKESSSVILPVIINIAEDILATQSKTDTHKEFLDKAITGLKKYDETQSLAKSISVWNIKSDISKLLSGLTPDLKTELTQLIASAKNIEIQPETAPLWYEAACWLNGFYQRAQDTKNGWMEGIINSALKMAIDLNQLEIAFYYHQLACIILEKLSPKSEAKETNNPALLFKTPPPSPHKEHSSKNEPAVKFQ